MFNPEERNLIRLACKAAVATLVNEGHEEQAKPYQAIVDKLRPLTEEEEIIGY